MNLWNKIILYKNLIKVFVLLNIVTVVTGSVIGFSYWTSKSNYHEVVHKNIEKLERFEVLKKKLKEVPEDKAKFIASSLNEFLPEMNLNRVAIFKEIKEANLKIANTNKELALIGFLTLLFGFVLPGFVVSLLSKALSAAKKQFEVSVANTIADWTKLSEGKTKEEKFQPEFWVRIVIITAQHWTIHLNHPASLWASEVIKQINLELEKKDQSTTDNVITNINQV